MKTGWVLRRDALIQTGIITILSAEHQAENWKNIDGKWYYFKYSAVKGSREIEGKIIILTQLIVI